MLEFLEIDNTDCISGVFYNDIFLKVLDILIGLRWVRKHNGSLVIRNTISSRVLAEKVAMY